MTAVAAILAGGFGAAGRYWISGLAQRAAGGRFPVGTLAVNLSGSLAAGIAAGALPAGSLTRAVLVGLLAGFTTFSTWAAETVGMLQTGQAARALANAAGTVAAGVGLCALGFVLAN